MNNSLKLIISQELQEDLTEETELTPIKIYLKSFMLDKGQTGQTVKHTDIQKVAAMRPLVGEIFSRLEYR